MVLVGLACKNAILIVEFAKHLHTQGMPCYEATKEASRMRLRPICDDQLRVHLWRVAADGGERSRSEMRRSVGRRGVQRNALA